MVQERCIRRGGSEGRREGHVKQTTQSIEPQPLSPLARLPVFVFRTRPWKQITMTSSYCGVVGCTNNSKTKPLFSFFSLPKDVMR